MSGQIVVGGIDIRFVATSLADTAFQIVGDNSLGDTTQKGKGTNMRGYPVLNLLTQSGLGIGVVAGAKNCDKDLSTVGFTGDTVYYDGDLLREFSSASDEELVIICCISPPAL